MFVRALAPLRLAAVAGLVLAFTALVPASAFAQAPCRSPIPPGTYAGSMDGTLSVRSDIAQEEVSGLLTLDYHQVSDDLLLTIDCDAIVTGHGTLKLDMQATVRTEGAEFADVPQNLDVSGSGAFAVEIDGYVVRQPGKGPLLILTFYPMSGSGEATVQTTFEQPKRRFDVSLVLRFDVEDLDEVLQGEGVPFPLQVASQEDGYLTGDVFDAELTDALIELLEESFGDLTSDGDVPPPVAVDASGTWQLSLIGK